MGRVGGCPVADSGNLREAKARYGAELKNLWPGVVEWPQTIGAALGGPIMRNKRTAGEWLLEWLSCDERFFSWPGYCRFRHSSTQAAVRETHSAKPL